MEPVGSVVRDTLGADDRTRSSRGRAQRGARLGRAPATRLHRRARVGFPPAPRIEGKVVYSDVPSLVFQGELDPIVPPDYGRKVAERFSRSHYIEFPGFGHGVVRAKSAEPLPRCAMRLIAAFLDDPHATPDTSCIEQIPPLAF
ncbi:MAG TPA: alpha/beta hydrolase [Polyangiaceae bacterium]